MAHMLLVPSPLTHRVNWNRTVGRDNQVALIGVSQSQYSISPNEPQHPLIKAEGYVNL